MNKKVKIAKAKECLISCRAKRKQDGVTQPKTNTIIAFTRQFELLVKPLPIPSLFLIGCVITLNFFRANEKRKRSQNQSNHVITFDSHLKTAL